MHNKNILVINNIFQIRNFYKAIVISKSDKLPSIFSLFCISIYNEYTIAFYFWLLQSERINTEIVINKYNERASYPTEANINKAYELGRSVAAP